MFFFVGEMFTYFLAEEFGRLTVEGFQNTLQDPRDVLS